MSTVPGPGEKSGAQQTGTSANQPETQGNKPSVKEVAQKTMSLEEAARLNQYLFDHKIERLEKIEKAADLYHLQKKINDDWDTLSDMNIWIQELVKDNKNTKDVITAATKVGDILTNIEGYKQQLINVKSLNDTKNINIDLQKEYKNLKEANDNLSKQINKINEKVEKEKKM